MIWEAIGEVVGAIAVIATPIYIALQIRQNTSALRSTATQTAHDQAASIYQILCTDADMAGIFIRGTNSPDDPSDEELAKLNAFLSVTQLYMQNWYMQTRDQLMDDTLLSSWSNIVARISSTPGCQQFWERRSYVYSPAYKEYLEKEVLTQASDGPYDPLGVRA